MIILKYYPEGTNKALSRKFESYQQIKDIMKSGDRVEGKVLLCDSGHNLHIDLGVCKGVIPYREGAFGIQEGTLRDIALISKVNKTVCFRIQPRISAFCRLHSLFRLSVYAAKL